MFVLIILLPRLELNYVKFNINVRIQGINKLINFELLQARKALWIFTFCFKTYYIKFSEFLRRGSGPQYRGPWPWLCWSFASQNIVYSWSSFRGNNCLIWIKLRVVFLFTLWDKLCERLEVRSELALGSLLCEI